MLLTVFRIILAVFFALFLPGFAWSWVFFPKKELDWLERAVLGFGLSIAMVPLTVFALNRAFGVRINSINVFLEITALVVLGLGLGHALKRFDLTEVLKKLKKLK